MIIKKVEELSLEYQKLIDRFRNTQSQNLIDIVLVLLGISDNAEARRKSKSNKCLPGILKTFLEQSYSDDPFYLGLSPAKVKSVESNRRDTIDVLFEDDNPALSPWIHLQFVGDYKEVLVRGGPVICDYTLMDEDKEGRSIFDPKEWVHTFSIPRKLYFKLLSLRSPNYLIREDVQSYEKIITINDKVIIAPVKFPISSTIKIAGYNPSIDFEIREEILSIKELPNLLYGLRDVKIDSQDKSTIYEISARTSELNPEEDYSLPKEKRAGIK